MPRFPHLQLEQNHLSRLSYFPRAFFVAYDFGGFTTSGSSSLLFLWVRPPSPTRHRAPSTQSTPQGQTPGQAERGSERASPPARPAATFPPTVWPGTWWALAEFSGRRQTHWRWKEEGGRCQDSRGDFSGRLGCTSSRPAMAAPQAVLGGAGSCPSPLLTPAPWFPGQQQGSAGPAPWAPAAPGAATGCLAGPETGCRGPGSLRRGRGQERLLPALRGRRCDLERCGPGCSCFHGDVTSGAGLRLSISDLRGTHSPRGRKGASGSPRLPHPDTTRSVTHGFPPWGIPYHRTMSPRRWRQGGGFKPAPRAGAASPGRSGVPAQGHTRSGAPAHAPRDGKLTPRRAVSVLADHPRAETGSCSSPHCSALSPGPAEPVPHDVRPARRVQPTERVLQPGSRRPLTSFP